MTYGKLSEDNPVWIMYLVKINHLLLAINSAINIVIYSFKVMKYNILLPCLELMEIISPLLSFSYPNQSSVFSTILSPPISGETKTILSNKLQSYRATVTNIPFLLSIESNSETFAFIRAWENIKSKFSNQK